MMLRVSTTVCRVLIGTIGIIGGSTLFAAGPAFAWTTATGPRGGTVAVGPRGAAGVGPYGGAAIAGPRGAAAIGPNGRAAVVGRPGYPAYRPPVAALPAVPVYPGYAQPVAPLGGAVVAGVVAGATAGAIARATTPPPVVVAPATPAAVVTAPSPSGGALAIGATLAVLPAGCTTQRSGSVTYYRCGSAWLRPYMEGPTVAYPVVPAP